jgi:hypothetical protein
MIMGEQAKAWISKEFARLRDFMAFTNHKYSSDMQPVLLQEGGVIENQLLETLSPEIWMEFQVEFIDAVKVN